MNRIELLSNKVNKFIKRDYPIIEDIVIDDVSINNNFIDFVFLIYIKKTNFINLLGINENNIDLITSSEDNAIDTYWLKKLDNGNLNWLDIRKDLKSFSKMYYNEKIQNFICKVILI